MKENHIGSRNNDRKDNSQHSRKKVVVTLILIVIMIIVLTSSFEVHLKWFSSHGCRPCGMAVGKEPSSVIAYT